MNSTTKPTPVNFIRGITDEQPHEEKRERERGSQARGGSKHRPTYDSGRGDAEQNGGPRLIEHELRDATYQQADTQQAEFRRQEPTRDVELRDDRSLREEMTQQANLSIDS